MPTNNFIQFNSNKKDMMNDTEYATNDKVVNGVLGGGTNSNSIADSRVHNKLFYQLSTFCKAFADLMNELNVDSEDTDLEKLKNNIKQTLTQNIINIFTPTASSNTYTVDDLDIKYLISQTEDRISGYINLGKAYNNFMIQFGVGISSLVFYPGGISTNMGYHELCYVTLPVAYTTNYNIFAMHLGTLPVGINEYGAEHTLSNFTLEAKCYSSGEPSNSTSLQWRLMWMTIGW